VPKLDSGFGASFAPARNDGIRGEAGSAQALIRLREFRPGHLPLLLAEASVISPA
jgi:hypothetical protein